MEHWAISLDFEKTWCCPKGSPFPSTPAIEEGVKLWLFQWTKMVGNGLVILWVLSGDQALSLSYWYSIFMYQYLKKIYIYLKRFIRLEFFFGTEVMSIKNKFPTAHILLMSKKNWIGSKYSSYCFSLSWEIPWGFSPQKHKLELCSLLVTNAKRDGNTKASSY